MSIKEAKNYFNYLNKEFKSVSSYFELIEESENGCVDDISNKLEELSNLINDCVVEHGNEELTFAEYNYYTKTNLGEYNKDQFQKKISRIRSNLRNKKINGLLNE